MSIEATLATWKLGKEVTAIQKLILLALADRADEEGKCFPSLRRLEADTNLNRKTLIENRQLLIQQKLIAYTGEVKGSRKQIPVMKLLYISHREGKLNLDIEENFTSTESGTGKYFTSTENGTGTSTENGTLNLSLESRKNKNNIYVANAPLVIKKESSLNPTYEYPDTLYPKPEISRQSKQKQPLSSKLSNFEMENPYEIPIQMIMDWKLSRDKKKKPVTKTVWNKILKELEKCKVQGINPIEAFEEMVCQGWASLKSEYFNKNTKFQKPITASLNNSDLNWAKNIYNEFGF